MLAFGDCCLIVVNRCSLFVACCLLLFPCSLLFVFGCKLFVVSGSVFVACCLLLGVCRLSCVVCGLFVVCVFVDCDMWCVAHCLLLIVRCYNLSVCVVC